MTKPGACCWLGHVALRLSPVEVKFACCLLSQCIVFESFYTVGSNWPPYLMEDTVFGPTRVGQTYVHHKEDQMCCEGPEKKSVHPGGARSNL